jgi:hypothetical protein
MGRKRALQTSHTTLTITAFLSEITLKDTVLLMDPQDFDGVNPYHALKYGNSLTSQSKDSIFKGQAPDAIVSNHFKSLLPPAEPPFRKTAIGAIPVSPLITASIQVFSVSSHGSNVLLTIQLETKSTNPVQVEQVSVEMPGGLITCLMDEVIISIFYISSHLN